MKEKKVQAKEFNIICMEVFEEIKTYFCDMPYFLSSFVQILKELQQNKLIVMQDVLLAIKPSQSMDYDYDDLYMEFLSKAKDEKLSLD